MSPETNKRRVNSHSLDFVANQEDVVLLAERLAPLKVVLGRDDDTASEGAWSGSEKRVHLWRKMNSPSLSLDRLDEERGNVLAVRFEGTLEGIDVVVREATLLAGDGAARADALHERAKVVARIGVGAHAHDADPAENDATRVSLSASCWQRESRLTCARESCPRH